MATGKAQDVRGASKRRPDLVEETPQGRGRLEDEQRVGVGGGREGEKFQDEEIEFRENKTHSRN